MTVSVLGALSASIELHVAVRVLGGTSKAALSRATLFGARIGGAAGVVDGAYTMIKGVLKASTGDYDSGLCTIASGAAFAVAGISTFFMASGPVGWTLLLIGAIGAGLYCAWQAYATDDENLTPVEYWLDNGTFGKGEFRTGERALKNPFAQGEQVQPFPSMEYEVLALQKIVLVAQAQFGKITNGRGGYSRYEINLPRYAKGTRLEVTFHIYQDGQRLNVGELLCEVDQILDIQGARCDHGKHALPDDHTKGFHYRYSGGLTGRTEPPEIVVDKELLTARIKGSFATIGKDLLTLKKSEYRIAERLGSKVRPESLYADSYGMTLKYWPNREEMPELMSEFAYPTPRT